MPTGAGGPDAEGGVRATRVRLSTVNIHILTA